MSSRTIPMTDRLYDYLLKVSLREPPLLAELRAETAKLPMAMMQISPEQGQFMALLAELIGARKAIEVGTFTGYSALCVAGALPPDGKLIACDISEEFTAVARRYWAKSGIGDRIELRLAPALDTLKSLLKDGGPGSFDFAFIDADKTQYDAYYEAILKLLRPGGLIAIDNVLWSGAVADGRKRDADTVALRALNEKLKTDKRVTLSMLPIGDGLTLARKR
ncbi:MAG TPA: class I SAM-dependent methyltransferase [Candidatus Acidoferrum sp.]|nr:class I SAM-dependent methyltransferase [Candidatus Acidoferrum sp.]